VAKCRVTGYIDAEETGTQPHKVVVVQQNNEVNQGFLITRRRRQLLFGDQKPHGIVGHGLGFETSIFCGVSSGYRAEAKAPLGGLLQVCRCLHLEPGSGCRALYADGGP